MKRTVKMDHPYAQKGAELEVPGLGLFINGETREVTEEEVNAYEASGFVFPENGKLVLPLKTQEEDSRDVTLEEVVVEDGNPTEGGDG